MNQKTLLITGPAHTHPHNRELSSVDMGSLKPEGWSPVGPSRIVDPSTGKIWERELYAFFKDLNEVCFAYRYNYATRTVSALREGKWVDIGKAEGIWGTFTLAPGQDG